MSVSFIKRDYLRETPFFGMAGFPGRLYLEAFAFGNPDIPFGFGGESDVGPLVRSPLTLFPDKRKFNSLLDNLAKLMPEEPEYAVTEKMKICWIGTDNKLSGRRETEMILTFFECDLGEPTRMFGVNNHRYEVQFSHFFKKRDFLTVRSW